MEKEKTKYEIDSSNRLIYAKTDKKSLLPKYRKVLDGKLKIDENNTLTYHIKESQDSTVPQQIKLSGKYSLDKNHNLILTLDKWNNQYAGNKLTIKGEIIDAKDNELALAITTKDSLGKTTAYILKLGGSWQADKYNRLTFNVKKESGEPDKLVFEGIWEINKQNQIIYTYTKERLKTKEKTTQTITLKGYWDITEKHRLFYVLNKEINSQFDFKVSLGEPFKRGLKYEIGIGARPKRKEVTLFGSWKVTERLELLFEMQYEKGAMRNIVFGGTCKLDDKHNFDFKLKSKQGQDLEIDLKLSRKILKDQGEIFLRGLLSKEEKQIVLGAGWRW